MMNKHVMVGFIVNNPGIESQEKDYYFCNLRYKYNDS